MAVAIDVIHIDREGNNPGLAIDILDLVNDVPPQRTCMNRRRISAAAPLSSAGSR
ncbi:hypothetical protein ACFU98_33995 [Streptomyces sp. NPDC057575]|uniref:hypothetical protein n=1 Tax=unclassified Streptomyces TaxID=2593676 RepID=UPI0036A76261